jgi:hypothetical protein
VWGTLEVMTEDLFVAALIARPEFLEQEVFQRIPIPLSDFLKSDREQQLRILYRLFNASSSEKAGVNRFESPLNAVGLSGAVDKELSLNLMDLQELRNLIVHQSGIADSRFCQSQYGRSRFHKVGDEIPFGEPYFRLYCGSVLTYQRTVLERVEALDRRIAAQPTPSE